MGPCPAARRRRATVAAVGLALVLELAGWIVLTVSPPEPGGWGLADLLLLAALVPAGAALLMLPGGPDRAAGRGRTVVDGLIVATAAFGLGWIAGLEEVAADATGNGVGLAVLHVLGVVALAGMAVVLLTRARRDARRTFAVAAAGLVILAMADAVSVWLRVEHGTAPIWPMALAVAGLAVLGLASRTPSGSGPGLPTRASVYIPSVPLAVGVVALGAEVIAEGHLSDPLIAVGIALVVLVIARQIYALLENIAFWRDLESDVVRSEARFRSLVQNSSDVITLLGADGAVTYQSPSIQRVFGHDPEAVTAEGLDLLVPEPDLGQLRGALADMEPGDTRTLHSSITTHDGRTRRVEVVATNLIDDPDVGGLVLNMRDETERRALEDQLTHMAFHDPLTDLANRALFRDRVDHALARRRGAGLVAALFIDLDDFKNVNDTLGHGVGDDLLVLVGERLRRTLRVGDTISRLGGDEFAVLLEDVERDADATKAAEQILEVMNEPFELPDRTLHTRASIGIAVADEDVEDGGALLRNADTAMYAAKARGKGRFARFDGDMHGRVARRVVLENDLRTALAAGDLWLAYQPVMSLRTGRVSGVEALARWDHPEHGPIGPDEFIRVAEECGLIVDLGRWVLETALGQLRAWKDEVPGVGPLEMSVNLSAIQLHQPALGAEVASALAAAELPASCLVLELTESELIDGVASTIARLNDLRRAGVRVAIDDFGTGYSSLSYLLRLPVDKLKIDRSFVSAMESGTEERALVHAIVTMGHVLGLEIVAEGIETTHQLDALTDAGCDLGQGYHLGRPVPPAEIVPLLTPSSVPADVERHPLG